MSNLIYTAEEFAVLPAMVAAVARCSARMVPQELNDKLRSMRVPGTHTEVKAYDHWGRRWLKIVDALGGAITINVAAQPPHQATPGNAGPDAPPPPNAPAQRLVA